MVLAERPAGGRGRNSAPLSVAYCWVLWFRGQIGAIEAHLADAERAMHQSASMRRERAASSGLDREDTAYAQLPAELAALRSFVARYGNDLMPPSHTPNALSAWCPKTCRLRPTRNCARRSALALATAYDGAGDLDRAVDAYAETIRLSRLAASAAGVAGITYRLTGILRLLGRLRAADAACREALAYIQAQGMARLPAAGILHVAMSEVLVERNELEAAEAHLAQGLELGKWSGRLDAVRNAAYTLSRLRLARHDATGALAAVQEAEATLGEPPSPPGKGRVARAQGRDIGPAGEPERGSTMR